MRCLINGRAQRGWGIRCVADYICSSRHVASPEAGKVGAGCVQQDPGGVSPLTSHPYAVCVRVYATAMHWRRHGEKKQRVFRRLNRRKFNVAALTVMTTTGDLWIGNAKSLSGDKNTEMSSDRLWLVHGPTTSPIYIWIVLHPTVGAIVDASLPQNIIPLRRIQCKPGSCAP